MYNEIEKNNIFRISILYLKVVWCCLITYRLDVLNSGLNVAKITIQVVVGYPLFYLWICCVRLTLY